ncbi:MAG: hypothetical protein HND54_00995 [Bacteroidetes bacterium]|nr:hypothetical protein [Bacteroidota bacterium]
MARFLIYFILLLLANEMIAQSSNLRSINVLVSSDTMKIDSLSIIPQSEIIKTTSGTLVNESDYKIDYAKSLFISKNLIGKEIQFIYRVFPLNFSAKYAHKSIRDVEQSDPGKYDYFTIKEKENKDELFSINGLSKNGSISRGINFGNNQNLSVSSNLDLQLSGKVTDDISIQAAISDNNLPIQADGNTQQLQEFDRVYIRLFNKNSSLIAGDFLLSKPSGYFMNLNKKVQGGGFSTSLQTHKDQALAKQGTIKTSVNAAISRGKFSRNVIQGIEGNQGPYQLKGDEGENYIIVLSGTERVYINGRLMKRGQDNDYIIDYNTSELTFMPQQIITKDKRIVVEFQYSERNYARSLYFVENSFEKEKLKINFNVYSEQDNKKQPLQQELNDSEKKLLGEIGDNLNQAIVSGIDTTGFIDDQVLYRLTDTLGYKNVLVYSKNPDSAIYSAKFSLVGQGNGNYVQIRSDGNGRVFQWKQPIAGVSQGSYEPVIVLITPKKRQLITLGGAYEFSKNTTLKVEGAFSNNDVNTFSNKDANDNQSYGMRLDFKNSTLLRRSDSAISSRWNSTVFYEQIGRNFQFIERYRDVEFQRDWNIQSLVLEGNEYITKVTTGISKHKNKINYEFGSFTKGHSYEGIKNGFSANFQKKGFELNSKGSLLNVNALNNSEFLRHYTNLSQKLWGFKFGAYLEQEKILFYNGKSDSLSNASFNRIIWKAFVEKGDSTNDNSCRLTYSEIYDYFPKNVALNYALKSENVGLDFQMAKNPRSRLSGKVTYRRLHVLNKELASRDEENTLLGRLNYDLKLWKGFVSSNTYYQIGSGLENRREFSFLKVNDGQGTHVWNDYNKNQVKELNEFEVAGSNNTFQANYIKVFTPTSSFIRVFSNQFNQVLFLKPAAILNQIGWQKILAKFSNKTTFRAERKTQLEEDAYNPINTNVNDSSLVSINSSISNTVYFNRLDPRFGFDFYYLNNKGKSLLINGFESRGNLIQELKGRYNINRLYSIESRATLSEKSNHSELFKSRTYTIRSKEIQPTFIFQPNVRFRVNLSATYSDRENILGEETSINQTGAIEMQYNQAGKGAFSMNVSYIKINFNSNQNSSLSFEMLDGLQAGNNITWNISWQRNLSNSLQLNLTYGGRNSENIKTIHTGGMQVRAFF